MTRPPIDPDLGLDLPVRRTIADRPGRVSVIIPAHNEEATVAEVVRDSAYALELLEVDGEVLVSASGCTDATIDRAHEAGARVLESPIGKGAAIAAALRATDGDIVCLVDGDVRYFGDRPLAALLVEPILKDIADATVTDLYWRPLYPQMWLHAFYAPLCGLLFPELLPKAGSTPWSGQRAARRELWPDELPHDFTVDLHLLLHWNRKALRLRPVLADDWVNPQRPKDDLMEKELTVLLEHGVAAGRISATDVTAVRGWFEVAHNLMASYQPGVHSPVEYELQLLESSRRELQQRLSSSA